MHRASRQLLTDKGLGNLSKKEIRSNIEGNEGHKAGRGFANIEGPWGMGGGDSERRGLLLCA